MWPTMMGSDLRPVCLLVMMTWMNSANANYIFKADPSSVDLSVDKSVKLECRREKCHDRTLDRYYIEIYKNVGLDDWKVLAKVDLQSRVMEQTTHDFNLTYVDTCDSVTLEWTNEKMADAKGKYLCTIVYHGRSNLVQRRLKPVSIDVASITTDTVYRRLLESERKMKDMIDLHCIHREATNNGTNCSMTGDAMKEVKDFGNQFNTALEALNSRLDDMQWQMNALVKSKPWPQGLYALYQPLTGCPDTKQWSEGWIQVTTESSSHPHMDNKNNASSGNHFQKPLFTQSAVGMRLARLRYCVKKSYDYYSPEWPKGSYCLNRVASICPEGFQSGSVKFDLEDDRTFENKSSKPDATEDRDFLTIFYCCRSDGLPSERIILPGSKPFYLYKVPSRECQEVYGMTVSVETMTIDTQSYANEDSFYNEYHPDATLHPITMRLCYYQ